MGTDEDKIETRRPRSAEAQNPKAVLHEGRQGSQEAKPPGIFTTDYPEKGMMRLFDPRDWGRGASPRRPADGSESHPYLPEPRPKFETQRSRRTRRHFSASSAGSALKKSEIEAALEPGQGRNAPAFRPGHAAAQTAGFGDPALQPRIEISRAIKRGGRGEGLKAGFTPIAPSFQTLTTDYTERHGFKPSKESEGRLGLKSPGQLNAERAEDAERRKRRRRLTLAHI
jgi:hypothetical protein